MMATETTITITIDEKDTGRRLDAFLSDNSDVDITRSAAVRLIEEGNVTVNGKPTAKNRRLTAGDVIKLVKPVPKDSETAVAQNIDIEIVYEDDDIAVVNKPSGMVVHPAVGNEDGTLVNALLYRMKDSLSGIGGVTRPGIVHRIDKDTSGLLVVAKNDVSHLALSRQLAGHEISRIYTALVCGNIKTDSGTVDAPIGRHPENRKKMAVIKDEQKRSRRAITHYTVLSRYNYCGSTYTLIRCELETGRTHQIRVHMASIGHPLVGDTLYGGGGTKLEANNHTLIQGQCLHASELYLTHPTTGEKMKFVCDLQEDFMRLIEKLNKSTDTE